MPFSSLKVTVALVCYKEKKELAHTLQDLREQTAFKNIEEVLLLQNGTCKETKKIAESFFDKLPLKLFFQKENNLGQARAKLVERSQQDLIAWTDSDCHLPKSWLEELIAHWSYSSSVLALGGPNRLPENKFWKKLVNLSLSHPLGHGYSPQTWRVKKKTKTYHIPTSNALFSKKAILSVGSFSKNHKRAGEDLHIGLRLKKKGELWLFPNPLVINNYASSYMESLKRVFLFGKIRAQYKSLLFYPCLLFTPCFLILFILGMFQKYFFFPHLLYFFILFVSSFFVFFKSKKSLSLLLPFSWFSQHFFYSSGTFWAFFSKSM